MIIGRVLIISSKLKVVVRSDIRGACLVVIPWQVKSCSKQSVIATLDIEVLAQMCSVKKVFLNI